VGEGNDAEAGVVQVAGMSAWLHDALAGMYREGREHQAFPGRLRSCILQRKLHTLAVHVLQQAMEMLVAC
jgi:hypothetical protein